MAELIERRWSETAWGATPTKGVEVAVLRQNGEGGGSILLKFDAGAVGGAHNHPAGEELFVVSGDISIGGLRLTTGDYLYTPPNAVHEAVAHADTVLLLSLPKPPVFL